MRFQACYFENIKNTKIRELKIGFTWNNIGKYDAGNKSLLENCCEDGRDTGDGVCVLATTMNEILYNRVRESVVDKKDLGVIIHATEPLKVFPVGKISVYNASTKSFKSGYPIPKLKFPEKKFYSRVPADHDVHFGLPSNVPDNIMEMIKSTWFVANEDSLYINAEKNRLKRHIKLVLTGEARIEN